MFSLRRLKERRIKMLVTMYSLERFPTNIRSEFEILVWAYSEYPEDREEFEEYMRSLTVFRFDDSDTQVDGRNVSYPINIKLWEKPLIAPFYAYINSVYVNNDFVPITWPGGEAESSDRLKKIASHPLASDMLAWTQWNVKCEVEAYTSSMIKREIMKEYLDPSLCHQGKCWQPETKIR